MRLHPSLFSRVAVGAVLSFAVAACAGSSPSGKATAGSGAKENQIPTGIPTAIPTSIPGVPTGVPGVPGGVPTPGGPADVEGLNWKLPPCPPSMPGFVGLALTGSILMPKGDMALGAAKVTLVNNLGAETATTISDGCGRFRFDGILPGVYKVKFVVRTFKGEQTVNVPPGGTNVDIRVDIKFLQIAVFKGTWDHVENILDKVGVPYTMIPADKIGTTDFSKYNIAFINCHDPSPTQLSSTVQEKLKGFVSSGGALYVSDRALPYVTTTWPGMVKDLGNSGNAGTKKHTVFDFQLGSYLRGAMNVPIIYDMGAWRRLDKSQPANTLPLLRDQQTQEPAIVTFAYNNGFVGYTTYHQGAQMNDAMTFSLVFFITRL
ncbi:MAG: carboxypeptidase regulatory-like domain-containing protein [Myxococcales bacterium]|nr:carboxypeptidase regulatory-like domain-containing protein [Myxococcales bacterium]